MQAAGWQEPITDMDAADRFVAVLRTKYWMTRCTIVEEPAFQSRAARNRLQLVHVEERKSDFVGTSKPLFSLRSPNSRPGVPAILLREVQVDAAGQVLGQDGRELHFAEFLVQLRGEPMQDGKDTDKGVRISFRCEDIGDLRSTHSELFLGAEHARHAQGSSFAERFTTTGRCSTTDARQTSRSLASFPFRSHLEK
jgi:hypothetical protein